MKKTKIEKGKFIDRYTLGRSTSEGEYVTALYLKFLNLEFITESEYEINGHRRKFDFELWVNKQRKIIEVDGSQHFHDSEDFESTAAEAQFKDQVKQDFAINVLGAQVIRIQLVDADWTKYTEDYIMQNFKKSDLAEALLSDAPVTTITIE